MQKFIVVSILLICTATLSSGCIATDTNSGWKQNVPQLKTDIFIFSKLATRIALSEMDIQSPDIKMLEGYLVALQDLLTVPGEPNFTGARILVSIKLSDKYRVYGMTIIDLLERYLSTAKLNVTEDQATIIRLISSGIDGAISGVQELGL